MGNLNYRHIAPKELRTILLPFLVQASIIKSSQLRFSAVYFQDMALPPSVLGYVLPRLQADFSI